MPFAILIVPFFAFAAMFVLLALSQTHSTTQGTSFWQSLLSSVTGKQYVQAILGQLLKAARAVVSHMAASQLKHFSAYLYGMARLWRETFAAQRAQAQAATAVAGQLERAIPREAHKAAAPALARAKVADRHATRALTIGHSNTRALGRYRTQTNARLKADAHAIDVTLPRDIAGVSKREEALSRDQAKLRERTTSLENGATKTFEWIRTHPLSVVTGVFAGAVAVALGRMGLGGLRCKNFTNLLRNYGCGLGTLLGRLLPLAVLLGIGFDFPEFVKSARLVASGIGDAVAGIEGTFALELPPLPPPEG